MFYRAYFRWYNDFMAFLVSNNLQFVVIVKMELNSCCCLWDDDKNRHYWMYSIIGTAHIVFSIFYKLDLFVHKVSSIFWNVCCFLRLIVYSRQDWSKIFSSSFVITRSLALIAPLRLPGHSASNHRGLVSLCLFSWVLLTLNSRWPAWLNYVLSWDVTSLVLSTFTIDVL